MSFASMYGLLRTFSIACSPYVLKIRTARLVLTPWLCRNSMISRTCLASCHACAIRSRRLGPMPSTVCSSAARFSITVRTSAPNRPTSFFARIGPIPFTKPLPRYRSIPSAVVGGTVFMMVALNCSPCSLSLTHQPSALSHSPAVTEGSDPTTVVSSRPPRASPAGPGGRPPAAVVPARRPRAFPPRTQKPLSSLWKVTRSISPEISSVAGLRSGIAAFIGDSFSHGRSALGDPFGKAILVGFGCWKGSGRLRRFRGAGSLLYHLGGLSYPLLRGQPEETFIMPNAKRKILVTGSSGQIGSELVVALRARHGTQNVVACDIKPLEADRGLFELADVTDRETLQGIIRKHRIGSIYHLVSILSAAGEKIG